MQSSPIRVHGALLTVATLFSLNYILSKIAMAEFAPISFAWLRVAGSAVVLNVIARPWPRFSRADGWLVAGFAVLGVFLNQTLFLTGLALTSAHVAAILVTTTPVFALAAAIVLGRERATVAKISGIALAAGGALVVVGREGLEGTRTSLIGATLVIANCLAYSLYLVFSKPAMERLNPVSIVTRMFTWGSLMMLPVAAPSLLRQRWALVTPKAWLTLLIVIAGPTVIAYLLNAWALRHTDSSLVAAYTYVQPVLATMLAALFLHEEIQRSIAVAAMMIFAGVALAGRTAPAGPIAE